MPRTLARCFWISTFTILPALLALPAHAEDAAASQPSGSAYVDAGPRVDKIESIVTGLDLTAEQKAKVSEKLAAARETINRAHVQDGTPVAVFTRAMNDLRDALGGILTAEQKQQFRTKLEQAGFRQPQKGPLAAVRAGLSKLGLSDEQQTRIEGIVEEHQQKIRDINTAAKGDRAAAAEKIAPVMAEMRQQIMAVLTPEQLRQLASGARNAATAPAPGQ